MPKLQINNGNGFSLVEVMVAVALIGISAAAFLTLSANLNQTMKRSSNKVAEISLISEINSVIADKEYCKTAITTPGTQTLNLTGLFKPKIQLPSFGLVSENTKIDNIVIKELFVDSFQTPASTGVTGQLKVVGSLKMRTQDVDTASETRKRKTVGLITFVFDASTKKIIECFGNGGTDPKSSCTSLGFVWEDATGKCRPQPSQACTDIGGTWNGSVCVVGAVANPLSILNKMCSGQNVALIGFDSSGNPKCQTITAANSGAGGGGGVTINPPAATAAPCNAGGTNISSPDGSNSCYFSWNEAIAGTYVTTSGGTMNGSNGGTGSAKCLGDNTWTQVLYQCPSKAGAAVCVGGYNTIKSADGTNSCFFKWAQGAPGQSVQVVSSAAELKGGTLSGLCKADGGWDFSYNCPGTAVQSCGGGAAAVPSSSGKANCQFVWDQTPVGSAAVGLKSVSGYGNASGIYCKLINGTPQWDKSGAVINCP